jgi:hypothetical protein
VGRYLSLKKGICWMSKAYFYIFGTNGNTVNGEITGVPGQQGNMIFMGFCKPDIRSAVQAKDWIIGISNAKIKPRKILSIIEVKEKPKLWEAIKKYPQSIWSTSNKRGQIFVNAQKEGKTWKYSYIPDAPHDEGDKHNDMEKYQDTKTLIVGTTNSRLLEENGYPINNRVLSILRRADTLKGKKIDSNNPFGTAFYKKLGKEVSYGRMTAIVELTESDVSFFKSFVKSPRKQPGKNRSRKVNRKRSC